jgi:hypothetical protein
VVMLAARLNKSRKVKVQPLPADVAAALVEYLAGKPAGSPIWGGGWAAESRGADMLRIDLETAGIPYAVEGPDGPEYADFHALRHSFLTLGGRAGIDLRTLQELAGHSDPGLTARYSHRRLHDLAGAVDKLPNLVPTTGPNAGAVTLPLRLTGTDGAKSAVPGAVTGGAGRHQTAPSGNLWAVGGVEGDAPETLEMEGAGASRHRPASIRFSAPSRARTEDPLIKSLLQPVHRRPSDLEMPCETRYSVCGHPAASAPLATVRLHSNEAGSANQTEIVQPPVTPRRGFVLRAGDLNS